jgi:alkanesulfonate monooxygenase SsuD/methylene tetrahydromethanopterin reductase-like flavin-dependent oxidoreductase (luciferase family)
MSDRGFQFSVRQADACFIGGRSRKKHRDASRRAKQMAQDLGKTVRTDGMCTMIHAESDKAAQALARRYAEGDPGHAGWGVPADKLREPGDFVHDWMAHEGFSPRKIGATPERFNVIGTPTALAVCGRAEAEEAVRASSVYPDNPFGA